MQNTNMNSQVQQKVVEEDNNRIFRTIGEVSATLKISPHVLRFWESKFSTIKPHKRRGGHRYYSDNDIAAIKEIQELLYDKGLTIKGAKKFIKEKNSPSKNSNNNNFQSSLFEDDESEIENDIEGLPKNSESAEIVEFRANNIKESKDNNLANKLDKKMVSLLIKELNNIKNYLLEN